MSNNKDLLNQPICVKDAFEDSLANYFFFSKLLNFDASTATGTIKALRFRRKIRMSFNQEMLPFEAAQAWEFPDAYGNDKEIVFKLLFPSADTLRLIFDVSKDGRNLSHSLDPMVEDESVLQTKEGWSCVKDDADSIVYSSDHLSLIINKYPFKVLIKNDKGMTLFDSVSIHEKEGLMNDNPIPFGFIQKTGDKYRHICFSSRITQDEMFFGCGESFTRLNKRGQVVNLASCDTKGVCTENMYKPVPFYISSRGYGCFVATTSPTTLDFGHSYDGVQTIYTGDEFLDLVIYSGNAKKVLENYTAATGRSPILPDWSFGLWMGRITYKSQAEVMTVANKLRKYDIPCDVIHIDTGWFDEEWKCDFKFSKERFPDVKKMLEELHDMGFHVSLWQLPYFTPQNPLYKEIIDNHYHIAGPGDELILEDAIIDFTNPEATKWYKGKLKKLLELGIDAIKTDFGEAAPYDGIYKNGRSGMTEHNVFPVRYQKTVSDLTRECNNHPLVWARSAWAGSQRYPVHWGGDAENTNSAMASSLRAGLSFGLSGFSYWSHDIGGFVKSPDEDLYLRWLAFGMFTSHARCHGNPPKEPWEFSEEFTAEFRRIVKIRYNMMDYILKQAKICSERGWPMLRTLFFEIPEDKTCWKIEDEYFFGSDYLVAPIFESKANSRSVYLPKGSRWKDYFTGKVYDGGDWKDISTDNYIVVLKRE